MYDWPILSVVTFLPLVGALLIILMIHGDDEVAQRNARWVALWATLVTFVISLLLLLGFNPALHDFQFVEQKPWLGEIAAYRMGVDGISRPSCCSPRC